MCFDVGVERAYLCSLLSSNLKPNGNSLEEYRAAIGMFHSHTCRLCGPFVIRTDTYLNIFRTNLRCSLFFVCLLLLQDLNSNVNALFLLFTLHFILLVGNIESNPDPHELSQSISENNHTDRCISLCNINIRSIRNKIEFLETSLNNFDILVVTETHLDNQINDSDITLDSFPNIIHRKDSSNSGGGLLIYSKNDISISRKSELENNLDETIWVEIRSKGQSFFLCNTHRSPCTDIDYRTRIQIYCVQITTNLLTL